jgi:sugar O-acyltransferase (sialic acid O-acetyltransferase NeuD family)
MSQASPVHVLGAGGHAKVVARMLLELGHQVLALFDNDPAKWNSTVLGIAVRGPLERVIDSPSIPAVIAIGDNAARRRVAQALPCRWLTVVHPRAFVDTTVRLGPGSVILPGAVIQVDSSVGAHVIVNTCASVDHDNVLGDYVHVGPGSRLAGGAKVAEGAFLGTGVVVNPRISVGAWSTVGSGAVVVRDLPDHVVAMGVPARVARGKK